MTDYLALLHADVPENTPPLPTAKTAKSPSDSKDSGRGWRFSGEEVHYHWLVQSPAGSLEVFINPETTYAEMLERYPGATIAPMIEAPATPDLEAAHG